MPSGLRQLVLSNHVWELPDICRAHGWLPPLTDSSRPRGSAWRSRTPKLRGGDRRRRLRAGEILFVGDTYEADVAGPSARACRRCSAPAPPGRASLRGRPDGRAAAPLPRLSWARPPTLTRLPSRAPTMAAVVGLEDIQRARAVIDGVGDGRPCALGRRDLALDGYARAAQAREPAAHRPVQAARRGEQMSTLRADARARGLVAARAGNHAQGVALAAPRSGLRGASSCPWRAAQQAVATAGYGAEVVLTDRTSGELCGRRAPIRRPHARAPLRRPGGDRGPGHVGLELLEDAPDADTIVVPIGGGGLLSGLAVAVKALRPGVRIWACKPGLRLLDVGRPRSQPATRSTSSAARPSPTASPYSAPGT